MKLRQRLLLKGSAFAPRGFIRLLPPISFAAAALSTMSAQTTHKPVTLSGTVRASDTGSLIPGAQVLTDGRQSTSDAAGHYAISVSPGPQRIVVRLKGQDVFQMNLTVDQDRTLDIFVRQGAAVIVNGTQDALLPDPSTQVYASGEVLAANPGRPGVPVSIPGHPVETASGGIKAPQYFAPGVAGDHGEPIAQFFQVGSFLFQNNLTANAHGNGYADPNALIGATVGDVVVDNAGYNVRYGDHAVNLAVTYGITNQLPSFVLATSDGRDGALAAGWSPKDSPAREWIAGELLIGNGFLARPEERQQYRINGLKEWHVGQHTLTAYGIAYYGFSRVPGLIPLRTPVTDDTLDPRQADLTHTTVALLTDRWDIGTKQSLISGAYFQTYSLALRSNFGDGLIRQSEFRTVEGGSSTYTQQLTPHWQILSGVDVRRDAPRNLDLARLGTDNQFPLVTSNDLTITGASPFAAVSGSPLRHVQLYAGLRREQMDFQNRDLLAPSNSFATWTGLTAPKLNLTLGEATGRLPQISFSFGKAFHANDPRIGTGTGPGSLLITAREFQMIASRHFAAMDWELTLSKVTNSAELAKVDPDTGLQENVGPSVNSFFTLQGRRRFDKGSVQISWSEADARSRQDGSPIPEAPRTIVDAVGNWAALPLGLNAQGDFEYVKAKPLGDGFNGVPVREIRLALNRSFDEGRWTLSLNGQLNNGYTGQTTETLQLGSEVTPSEQVVGVPLRSYGAVSLQYRFRR